MTGVAVSTAGLGKRYRISHGELGHDRVTEAISGLVRRPIQRVRGTRSADEWLWALRDVTFDVRQGQVLGIIGRNGAGKSTLLKILSRVTAPTEGLVRLRGRASSLLEVGTGFHIELTGRENIYLSGSIMGMTRREIDRQFDAIVAFSETERFLDTPVKRYSSGMLVRLGFAVAAHLQSDILIVDEVLAVGDAAFQRKAMARMEGASAAGRTILFVSHNMPAVEALCDEAVLLESGSIVESGPASDVVQVYLRNALALATTNLRDRTDREGDGRLRFTYATADARTGETSTIRLGYTARVPLANLTASVGLFTARGERAAHLSSGLSGDVLALPAGEGELVCKLPRTALLPGQYRANLRCLVNDQIADWVWDAVTIDVADGDFFGTGRLPAPNEGLLAVDQRWSVEAKEG